MSTPKIHDLSVTLRPATLESRELKMTRITHEESARAFAKSYGLQVAQLPYGSFFNNEHLTLGSHDGTHIDAPYHFYPTSEGQPAKFMDEWPLERCWGPGLRLDFRHKKPSDPITEYDVEAELKRIKREPKPDDVVLLWTGGTDGFDADPKFSQAAAGLNTGALNYLFSFGVRLMATDSATIDVPISVMRERLLAGDTEAYFPIHRAGRYTEWTHAEKLANEASLPGCAGFHLMFFPIKIAGGTGAWIRAVAVEDAWLDGEIKLVDLSQPIMNASFESEPSVITTVHHDQSRAARAKELGWKTEAIPHAAAMDIVETFSHCGTHIDAPLHFGPGGQSIDQLPLEWFYADGVLLNFSNSKQFGGRISVADVRGEVDRVGARLNKSSMVLIRSGADERFSEDPAFPNLGLSLELEAFQWLLDQGVRVIGCDAESLDGPLPPMLEQARAGRREALYPLHYAGRERAFCLIEKMNLSKLPRPTGFKVAAMPVKLERAGGAWTRAVALVKEP